MPTSSDCSAGAEARWEGFDTGEQRRPALKKIIIAAVALVVLTATGLAALPLFLSAETIRAELAQRIKAATGRATRIDGPVSFSVFPTARLSAEGIGIAGLASDTEAFSVES